MNHTEWEYSREIYGEDCTLREREQRTEEILDFADMVFSMAYSGTDFAALLPKAYSPGRSGVPVHHIIREAGRIRALVDLYPVTLQLQGAENMSVKAVYVGTVSVHPQARGRGYMIELMRRAEEDARSQGCALMLLDGDRHRYQYYGYEHAGIRWDFHIETGNIKHCCARICDRASMQSPVYHFEEFSEESPYLDSLYRIYQRRLVTARPKEAFFYCLKSYGAVAYVIFRDKEPIGYLSLSSDGTSVSEMELCDVQELPRVLYDLMMEMGMEQLRVSVGLDETDKIEQLEKACDSCDMSMSHQVKILDYEAVLAFLLNWKQKYDTLVISDYVLGVKNAQTGHTEKYLLSVAEDGIRVSRTELEADTVLEELELVRVLTTVFCHAEQQKGAQNKIKNAPAGWFPLPFYLPEADTF
ncbi:MAG: GNAT family N-acetyltransferase [Lachnospiraceae bacterium]|nr:GNAT family N-acetyltransferase [Lachnospiraceae bacterium]